MGLEEMTLPFSLIGLLLGIVFLFIFKHQYQSLLNNNKLFDRIKLWVELVSLTIEFFGASAAIIISMAGLFHLLLIRFGFSSIVYDYAALGISIFLSIWLIIRFTFGTWANVRNLWHRG